LALTAVILIGAATGVLILLTRPTTQEPSYNSQVVRYIAPVLADNQQLSSALATLTPGGSPATVNSDLSTTQSAVQTAQQLLATVKAPTPDVTVAAQVTAALTAEQAWLKAAAAALSDPTSPTDSQLSGIGTDAQTKFQTLANSLPIVSRSTFPSSTPIAKFDSVATANALVLVSNTQFSNQVIALINQSAPAFQSVNTLFAQLQTAADGGSTDLTVPQAEQQIGSIIASRTSLATAAQALSPSTPAAKAVAADLANAFNASLQDDNDIANCLNQSNNGSVAYIFQGCLSASEGDASTATTDKQTFLTAYNQFRSSVGQPAVSLQF